MPYKKPPTVPFVDVQYLICGRKITQAALAEMLGCSRVTAKKKLDSPQYFTLGDLGKICRSAHIPAEDIRESIKFT